MRCTLLVGLSATALLSAVAGAQAFNYADFSSLAGLTLNGDAAAAGTVLRLTDNSAVQKAAVWRTQPVLVDAGFDTTIDFRISNLVGGGADGIVFVLHNDPRGAAAMGDTSGNLGYGADALSPAGTAIANSLAVEVDTFGGPFWNDPNHIHLSVHTRGTADNSAHEDWTLGAYPLASDISDGAPHTLRVSYQPGTLEVWLDGVLYLTLPYSLATGGTLANASSVGGLSLISGSQAHVGLTAANSGSSERHDILSWSWTSTLNVPAIYCTAGTSIQGCVPQISASHNPSVSFANPCALQVSQMDGQRNAIFFYGLDPLAIPWANGSTSFLCVKAPTQRLSSQNTGGTVGSCNGSLAIDWNAFQLTHPTALGAPWSAGAQAHCQSWYRDPAAVKTTGLSDAVTLTYQP